MSPSRRTLLRAAGAAAGLQLLTGRLRAQPTPAPARLRLQPVHVARDRIVKTIVGLRPFRPSGFVVKSERLGEQTIVHNYGHGGCGVTLSWGTAELAVAEVLRTGQKRVAVLGCGAVGLATARLLQQRGLEATIYARDLPPDTCSDVAGARWYPFDIFDAKVVTPQFLETLWRASRASYAAFKKLAGPEYGIFFRPTYAFQNSPFAKGSLLQLDSPVHDLLPGLRELSPAENPTPAPVTRTFQTMMIEPAIYLPAIMRDHAKAGGRVVRRELKSVAELATLAERVVVNCTGLGAATLFGDGEMYPIKGQLTILKAQPEIDYVALPYGLYMFPRRDGIILGGTFERHVATLQPNLEAEARILTGHAKFFDALPT
jgi:glycine/D-amino acid oxidase-like deaminating enzyme